MDPITIAFVSGLGIGLVKSIEKLAEKAIVDPALETGSEPRDKSRLKRGMMEKRDAEDLRKIILATLDDLNKQFPVGNWEKVF